MKTIKRNLDKVVQENLSLMNKVHILQDKNKELNDHIGDQNKTIDALSKPLEKEGLLFTALLEFSNQLNTSIYDLVSVEYSTADAFSTLEKLFQNLPFSSSRGLSLFAREYNLNQNKFFMKRIGRTSYGKAIKSYTTLLFSLLGIFELAYLIKKKQEGDENFLETYSLWTNKKDREELLKSLEEAKQGETVPYPF